MITWPLDNIEYTADAIGAYCANRTRGVFSKEGNFNVTPMGGFSLQVGEGLAWLIKDKFWGVAVLNKENTILTADIGSGEVPRYVSVVLQLDKTANESKLLLKYSLYGQEPEPPVRNELYDEIIIAHVSQNAGASEFTYADITDTRTNEEICGLMRDGVTEIPTEQLYAQASELIEDLDRKIKETVDRSGLMLNSVYDPGFKGVDVTNQLYVHSALSEISGVGANGYFVASFSGAVSEISIGGINYSVKYGEENEIELVSGVLYSFVIIGDEINFKSGGAGKNYKIIASITEPESPKENTLWVNTSVPIPLNGWAFASENPYANPQEGNIWFKTSDESNVSFSTSKNIVEQQYLIVCYQFVSNTWVKKTFKAFIGNEWVSTNFLIYSEGVFYASFTTSQSSVDSVINNGQFSNTQNGLYAALSTYRQSKGNSGYFDLTDYNTLEVSVSLTTANSYGRFYIVVGSTASNKTSGNASTFINVTSSSKVMNLDISSLKGSYYINCFLWMGANSTSASVTLHSLTLSR